MTKAEQFALCQALAAQIVARYRAEAPEGCDPQNTYVALATVVIGAGTAAYQGYQQKKQAEQAQKQAGAMGPAGGMEMPDYIPLNFLPINEGAVKVDQAAYGLSDRDFKRRHGGLLAAEKLFEQQTLKDQKGESELLPAVQNEFMRAGLSNALEAFGDTPGTLAAGSAGEAAVARNLGLSVLGFQDRNRANRERSLVTAESLFPRRQFGLTGADFANMAIENNRGENAFNQGAYGQALQNANAATATNNANAQASGQANAQQGQAIASILQLLVKGGGAAAGASGAGTTASTTAAPYGNPSNVKPITTGWAPGPQTGTYYVPKAA